MKRNELKEISLKAVKESHDKICSTMKEVEKIVMKHAKLGFFNCIVICETSKLREFERQVADMGISVYSMVNEENNGQLELEWH